MDIPYLKSGIIKQKGAKMLTALRSTCLRGICHNFKKMFKGSLTCPLKCNITNPQDDTVNHILICQKISAGSTLNLDKIYDDVDEKHKIARIFVTLMKRRTQLLEEADAAGLQLQPTGGVIPGPSSSAFVENGYASI